MVRKPSEWLEIVKEYFSSVISMTRLAAKYKVDSAKLKYLIKLYELHGEKPFTDEYEERVFIYYIKLFSRFRVLLLINSFNNMLC